MSDAWRSVKVRQFEQVMTAPSMALLRVTGTAARGPGVPAERPTLLADDGQEVSRFPALPSPPDARGALRAAYSVPAGVIKPQTVFSLQLADGHVIALPTPSPRPGAEQPPADPVDVEQAAEDRTAPEAQASVREELADANRRAEDALLEAAAARDQNEALERRNSELGDSLREQRATLDELEIWRGELERRLASMSTELGDAKTRLREAQQELQRVRAELTDAEERATLAEAQVAPLSQQPGAGEAQTAASAGRDVDLGELSRRAAAEAGELAAREIAEAVADQAQTGH
ncbi:MAG TPA: hypothetical protein VG371_16865 [Solirubrobacteraceae bacterium]|nr:hypothetical protein [Solirubrobacteraceae bacterium]